MSAITVTIIGMGPRGVSVLERLAHFVRALGWRQAIRVEIVDPGECGQGTHYDTQPPHLLTNTLASQVTIFPPESLALDSAPRSFLEWARAEGYRHFEGAFHAVGAPYGEDVGEQHYLPRYLLGRYFSDAFDRIVRALPPNVSVSHRRRRAHDLTPTAHGYTVHLDSGGSFQTDYVILAMGHGRRKGDATDAAHRRFVEECGRRNDKLDLFESAYPVEALGRISPGATVAIQGIGLTAHDVISHLTVGRGGRFVGRAGELRYEPSGREPRMLLFSRSGLPFSARAVNQKGPAGRYNPRFFTMNAISQLRERARTTRGDGRIDFVNEAMPLIMADMAYARHCALHADGADDTFEWNAQARAAIEAILDPVGTRQFDDLDAFRRFFRQFLLDDLAEVDKGNVKSPVKAATDVLRDLREQFRNAAEYAGFTPESNKVFSEVFVNTLNRIVFGPPKRRNLELLALLDQGFVDLAGGPGAAVVHDPDQARFAIESVFGGRKERRHADVLVVSRIDVFSPLTDRSPLVANLMTRGLIRAFENGDYHPGGIDIAPTYQVVGRDGLVNDRVWAIGYPVEGPHYYTQELPRPGRKSRLTIDAEICVQGLFASLGADSIPQSPPQASEAVLDS
ncbi:FAD/NAD(P)-binding protein [Trinickia diaoshuihuensis]|uniref:FAD/NAD(P)-binding protein n=1 Tax=Trinickia diaoshuihuensis TaxID=2292265 RepID=UPI0019686067|nr:FAD/NAD(P)-binding protein [Trinickia diaoshuihuensis]